MKEKALLNKLDKQYRDDDRFKRYDYIFRMSPNEFAAIIWDYTNITHAPIEVECVFLGGKNPSDFHSEDSPIYLLPGLDEKIYSLKAQYKSDRLTWLVIDVFMEEIGSEADKYWKNFLEYLRKHDLLENNETSTNGDKKNDTKEPCMKVPDNLWHRDAVKLLHEGKTHKVIADRTRVATRTVSNLFTKLRYDYGEDTIPYRKNVHNKKKGNS